MVIIFKTVCILILNTAGTIGNSTMLVLSQAFPATVATNGSQW